MGDNYGGIYCSINCVCNYIWCTPGSFRKTDKQKLAYQPRETFRQHFRREFDFAVFLYILVRDKYNIVDAPSKKYLTKN